MCYVCELSIFTRHRYHCCFHLINEEIEARGLTGQPGVTQPWGGSRPYPALSLLQHLVTRCVFRLLLVTGALLGVTLGSAPDDL